MGTGESGIRAMKGGQTTWPLPSSNHCRHVRFPTSDNTTNFTKIWLMHVRLAHVIFRDKCVFLNVKDFEGTNKKSTHYSVPTLLWTGYAYSHFIMATHEKLLF